MRFSLAIVILVFLVGCQQEQQVSLDSWQESVEHYVWDQGNGDPSALRDLPTPGNWKGFSVISENDPGKATDVNGVLLAHRAIGAKPYFIYLVALVPHQQVADIRLAAMWASPDGFQWRLTKENSDALRVYRDFENAQWRKGFPQRPDGPWSHTGFPGEGDVFKLAVSGGKIVATHEQSGASWTLELPQGAATTAPAVAGSD
jgi:hypothetical protein